MNERHNTQGGTGFQPVNERDKILARIREALTVPAPRPGSHGELAGNQPRGTGILPVTPVSADRVSGRDGALRRPRPHPSGRNEGGESYEHSDSVPPPDAPLGDGDSAARRPYPGAVPGSARRWLPKVGDTAEEQLELFARNAAGLKASFQWFASWDDLNAALIQLRDAENWRRVASHQAELTGKACATLKLPVCWTDRGYDVLEMEQCDAGITECDALIAQTGSVLVTSRSAGGRALSILPPHHLVIARREQLVADLPAAFALIQQKYAPEYPSMISFITGPSRTGDIERILVLGAHGPKKLTIFCV